jgi:hypothetical protein
MAPRHPHGIRAPRYLLFAMCRMQRDDWDNLQALSDLCAVIVVDDVRRDAIITGGHRQEGAAVDRSDR